MRLLVLQPLLLGICLLIPASGASSELSVVYPQARSSFDETYFVKVLQLALEQSGVAYNLRTSRVKMEKGRALQELEQGGEITVAWALTTRAREEALLPIRIPLDKGLMGWRVLMIKPGNAAKFSAVHDLDDLGRMSAGQGFDWPDTAILRANGLSVHTGNSAGLLAMLAVGRFDYMPQSVLQAWSDADLVRSSGIVVEQSVVLHYPTAIYFFVNKADTALAAALERGLHRSLGDGRFEALFSRSHSGSIRRARLDARRVLELRNPDLPALTPLENGSLWFHPAH